MGTSIFDKKDILVHKKHSEISFEEFTKTIPTSFKGYLLETIDTDTVGNSNAKPRWGYVYTYENGDVKKYGKAIYKEPDYDYDYGPYSEKIWSILAKLMLPNVRVPNIDIIRDTRIDSNIFGTMSYSIVDIEQDESLAEFRNVLGYNSVTDEIMKAQEDRLYIEELLEHIDYFVKDEEKYKDHNGEHYKELEESIIRTIMLDCITNSFDRHPDNWGLVRIDKENKYKLGVYDNTVSFVNIIFPRPGCVTEGNWGRTFIRVKNKDGKVTDRANEVLRYIYEKYPQYFIKFSEDLEEVLDIFNEQIENYQNGNVKKALMKRNYFLKSLYTKEQEYDR